LYYLTIINLSKLDNIDIIDDNGLKNIKNKFHGLCSRLRFLKLSQLDLTRIFYILFILYLIIYGLKMSQVRIFY
jgi:hypothetical protein